MYQRRILVIPRWRVRPVSLPILKGPDKTPKTRGNVQGIGGVVRAFYTTGPQSRLVLASLARVQLGSLGITLGGEERRQDLVGWLIVRSHVQYAGEPAKPLRNLTVAQTDLSRLATRIGIVWRLGHGRERLFQEDQIGLE